MKTVFVNIYTKLKSQKLRMNILLIRKIQTYRKIVSETLRMFWDKKKIWQLLRGGGYVCRKLKQDLYNMYMLASICVIRQFVN